MSETLSPTRRRFYIAAIYGLSSLIAAALGVPAAIYLLFPPRPRDKEEWTEAGDLARLTIGHPEEVVFRHNRKDGWKIASEKATAWVARLSEKDVVAYAPQCTHLGCAYHWDESSDTFLCPCHTSTFSLDGKVLSGPAPRPLDRYELKVENGKLLLGRVIESQEG